MKPRLLLIPLFALALSTSAAQNQILGWNNLGMHCMDSDYSVFTILPPYNTIEAQLIVNGALVTNGTGYSVTYEAVADPDGSINKSSIGKGNWADFETILYGAPLGFTADLGLAGWNMPGPLNTPQTMLFENFNAPAAGVSTPVNWFRAEGIPLTPYDDAGNKNPYPMMHLVARDAGNNIIAASDIVLPVSDEMDCRACHGANTQSAAMPAGGWITDTNKIREYRLNILAVHDDREFANHPALFAEALAARGLNPAGLLATSVGGHPILCASCHASEALGLASFTSSQGNGTVPPLTASVHTKHAGVMDPTLNVTLNAANNRSACYRCHPGSTTRCLRGAMGSAVASDGSMAMQCQSCHGNMAHVGSPNRVGWFMEPKCQSCHTGTATSNSGQIRFLSVFDGTGNERVPADSTFATTANTPATGISLYRFSVGHGGLQCSACHGSTHAEFPSSHRNDNIRDIQLQGHAGVMVECTACHVAVPRTVNGGPHGMHPVGQNWVSGHGDAIQNAGTAACQACHGADLKGTELSRVQGDRTLTLGDFGTQVSFFRGATIGCFTCHNGPGGEGASTAQVPAIANVSTQTIAGVPVSMTLPVTLSAGVTVRVISQPANGTVGISSGVATYFPFAGFVGTDTFTFAAYNGAKNSVLATGTILVSTNGGGSGGSGGGGGGGGPQVPFVTLNPSNQTVLAGSTVAFAVAATGTAPLKYQWFKNTYPISGATNATLKLVNVSTTAGGGYKARVSNSAGATYSATATLAVLIPAKIASFTPPSGGVGIAVTITGSNFTNTSAINFNGVAAPFTVLSATTIVAGVPAGATTGKISVTTPVSTATSAMNFIVGTKPVAPVVSSFSPTNGTTGTVVTVNGSNLGSAASVRLGNTYAAYRVLGAGKLSVTVPPGATTGKISVTTAGGTGVSGKSFVVNSGELVRAH
jgi:hypothetical protein